MIDFIKIQDEVNRLLVERYPDFAVYINKVPKGFERPSFLIEFISNAPVEANNDIIKEISYFTVTYFGEVNDYYNTDKLVIQDVLVNTLKIFRKGYIEVEDRAIKVKASNGGSNDDEVYIDLQFEYFEDRLEEYEEYDLMQEIIIDKEVS